MVARKRAEESTDTPGRDKYGHSSRQEVGVSEPEGRRSIASGRVLRALRAALVPMRSPWSPRSPDLEIAFCATLFQSACWLVGRCNTTSTDDCCKTAHLLF